MRINKVSGVSGDRWLFGYFFVWLFWCLVFNFQGFGFQVKVSHFDQERNFLDSVLKSAVVGFRISQ
jgi:hypothetical protein